MDQGEGHSSDYQWFQCEAMIDQLDWFNGGAQRQCSRATRITQPELCDLRLCNQHVEKAMRHGYLDLTDDRTLELDEVWSDDGNRRILVSAKIVKHEKPDPANPPAPVVDIAEYRRNRER
jgi:hypothetical protein